MSDPVHRARTQFSTIQITMVSIVVALALQEWLDRLPTIDAMWEPTLIAVRIWCQALTAVVIIVKMWTGFLLSSVIDERVPRPIDLLGPIGILVFVDAQIANIDAEHVLRWWYVLGAGSLVAAGYLAAQSAITREIRGTINATTRSMPSPSTAELNFWRPEMIESVAGSSAIGIAVLHQVVGIGETGTLVACTVFLAGELVSATGPLLGWHTLRQMERLR